MACYGCASLSLFAIGTAFCRRAPGGVACCWARMAPSCHALSVGSGSRLKQGCSNIWRLRSMLVSDDKGMEPVHALVVARLVSGTPKLQFSLYLLLLWTMMPAIAISVRGGRGGEPARARLRAARAHQHAHYNAQSFSKKFGARKPL